jgi:hypothetical protein
VVSLVSASVPLLFIYLFIYLMYPQLLFNGVRLDITTL